MQEDGTIRISFNGTSRGGTHISGYYYVNEDIYEELNPKTMKQKVYDVLLKELKEEDVIEIHSIKFHPDEKVQVSFKATTEEKAKLTGHYFLTKKEFEETNTKRLKVLSYDRIAEDFAYKDEDDNYELSIMNSKTNRRSNRNRSKAEKVKPKLVTDIEPEEEI